MFWTIYYKNGIALTEADDREAARRWCEKQLGRARGPFAITPAIEDDLKEFGLPTYIDQKDLEIARSICESTILNVQAPPGLEAQGTLH